MSPDIHSSEPVVFAYGPIILWERPIQTVASMFVQPGDAIIDVGANTGGLAIALRRLIGPSGTLLAFECNPRMVEWCKRNFAANDATDTILETRACYSVSGKIMQFVCEDSAFGTGSSLASRSVSGQTVDVETVTLDDACAAHAISPRFLKIDVEGAEVDVLNGARGILAANRPAFVFERDAKELTPENDPLRWAIAEGFVCYDVNTLTRIDADWPGTRFANNILAVPADRDPRFTARSHASAALSADGLSANTGPLSAGLYVIDVKFAAESWARGELDVRNQAGERILYFDAPLPHLADATCASFPIKLDRPDTLTIALSAPDASPPVAIDAVSVRAF